MEDLDPVFARLGAAGLAAVVSLQEEAHAVPLARALLAGGVRAMELTLRSEGALACLARISKEVPEMLVGAGTVLWPAQVSEAKDAGAAFGVAPGCNPQVVAAAAEERLPFAPGVATPTDIELAVSCGCRVLKFFPADGMGGLRYLVSVSAPYLHLGLRYIPLGGVNEGNLAEYLSLPEVLAVGGSWLVPGAMLATGDWHLFEQLAARAREIVQRARREGE